MDILQVQSSKRPLEKVGDAELKALREQDWRWTGIYLYQQVNRKTDRMHYRLGPIRLIPPKGKSIPFPKGTK